MVIGIANHGDRSDSRNSICHPICHPPTILPSKIYVQKWQYDSKNLKNPWCARVRVYARVYSLILKGKQTLRLDKVNLILNLFGSEIGAVQMTKADEQWDKLLRLE